MTNTNYKPQFSTIIDHLKSELSKVRTSRATPALVEDVVIEAYGGSRLKLKELASISIPDPKSIVISPWDKSIIKDIEKGLVQSTMEFNPVVETDILRIKLPELTQETRERLVKKVREMLEETRVKIRHIRDDVKKSIEQSYKNKEIGEDDKFSLIEELNKITREFTDEVDELGKKKEEEIRTV